MASDKGKKLIIGLAVMVLIAVVGFSLYQTFTGNSSIGQTFVFILLGLAAFGMVRFGIATNDRSLSMENFISLLILIGAPITLLILLPKIGINLFSIVGESTTRTISLADFEGGIIGWIKDNLYLTMGLLVLLYAFKDKIKKIFRR